MLSVLHYLPTIHSPSHKALPATASCTASAGPDSTAFGPVSQPVVREALPAPGPVPARPALVSVDVPFFFRDRGAYSE